MPGNPKIGWKICLEQMKMFHIAATHVKEEDFRKEFISYHRWHSWGIEAYIKTIVAAAEATSVVAVDFTIDPPFEQWIDLVYQPSNDDDVQRDAFGRWWNHVRAVQ